MLSWHDWEWIKAEFSGKRIWKQIIFCISCLTAYCNRKESHLSWWSIVLNVSFSPFFSHHFCLLLSFFSFYLVWVLTNLVFWDINLSKVSCMFLSTFNFCLQVIWIILASVPKSKRALCSQVPLDTRVTWGFGVSLLVNVLLLYASSAHKAPIEGILG